MKKTNLDYTGIRYPVDAIIVVAPNFEAYKYFTDERPLTGGCYVYALSINQVTAMLPSNRLIKLPGWEAQIANHEFVALTGWLLQE